MKSTSNFLGLSLALVISVSVCGKGVSKSVNETNPVENVSLSEMKSSTTSFDFERFTTGELPSGWSQFYTGQGGTDWKVTNDNGNKVMAQLFSENPNGHFNMVVNDQIQAKDMELTVRLKGISGKEDQGGGFVWRFIDKNNHYIVRANPLEDNVVLYKMENGKRTDLPLIGKGKTYGVEVPPMGLTWHTLKLEVKGNLFTVYMDNVELFKVEDSTFPEAGKVGLWTKADAVTYFDDFKIDTK